MFLFCWLLFLIFANESQSLSRAQHSFVIRGNNFEKDGVPFRIVSGSIHYFRVHPSLWRDRLRKLRAMDLNAIQTYFAWNFHQPKSTDPPDFSSAVTPWRDVATFIKIAEEEDLLVIVRPGPYICAEWEWGGMPSWLIPQTDRNTRCSDPTFLSAVDIYLDALLKILSPLQYNTGGGPIILAQVENEYGSFGNDHSYLQHLADLYAKHGFSSTPLFASNGANALAIEGGSLSTFLRTANFGWNSDAGKEFGVLREFQKRETGPQPLFCTEWWDGWFDFWGCGKHHTVSHVLSAVKLDLLLRYSYDDDDMHLINTNDNTTSLTSVNLYMAHGGTNFGFYNGADIGAALYEPLGTSYDYDAPLNESGDPTDKFHAYREVISKFVGKQQQQPLPPVPTPAPKSSYGGIVHLTEVAYFVSGSPASSSSKNLATLTTNTISSALPQTMEQLGQNFGFVMYQTQILGPLSGSQSLSFSDGSVGGGGGSCKDRCHAFVDGIRKGILYRNDLVQALVIDDVTKRSQKLEVLVENMGRVNFGQRLVQQSKGIVGNVLLDSQFLFGWTSMGLPMEYEQISKLVWEPLKDGDQHQGSSHPAFLRGFLDIADPALDTFVELDFSTFTKGVVYVNGFNLGRYWKMGPQKTLYLPAPLLVKGKNEFIILETDSPPLTKSSIGLTAFPKLG